MGEVKRRREALNAPELTTELKQQIANVVRSVTLITSQTGGMCLFRALSGHVALTALGFQSSLMYGGCLFPAAPGDLNILSMGGPGGIGMLSEDGMLIGHVWLKVGTDLVDFSAGDWHVQSDEMTEEYFPDLPLIDWQIEPPPFVWEKMNNVYFTAPVSDFDVLTLGKPRYCAFLRDHAEMLRNRQKAWVDHLRTTAGPLLNSVRHSATELPG